MLMTTIYTSYLSWLRFRGGNSVHWVIKIQFSPINDKLNTIIFSLRQLGLTINYRCKPPPYLYSYNLFPGKVSKNQNPILNTEIANCAMPILSAK